MAQIIRSDLATNNANPGILKVNITPSYAATEEGCHATLCGGAIRVGDANTEVVLSPGQYTVNFVPIKGYTTPASQTVTVSSNQTTTVNVTFEYKAHLSSWNLIRTGYTPVCMVKRNGSWHTVTASELLEGYFIEAGDIVYCTNGEMFVNFDNIDCYFINAMNSPYWKSVQLNSDLVSFSASNVVPD